MRLFAHHPRRTVLSDPELHDLAVKVRNELTRRGWTAGEAESPSGKVCAFRAYQYSTPHPEAKLPNAHAEAFARGLGFRTFKRAVRWNDSPGRRIDHVLAALDGLIQRTSPAPHDPTDGYEPQAEALTAEEARAFVLA